MSDETPREMLWFDTAYSTFKHGGSTELGTTQVARALMALADSEAASLRGQVETLQAELAESDATNERLEAEVQRLSSWHNLMALMDQHWPESIFPVGPDNPDRDLGPRILSLARLLWRAEAERDRARDIAAHLRAAVRDCIEHFRTNAALVEESQANVDGAAWHYGHGVQTIYDYAADHLEAELAKEVTT